MPVSFRETLIEVCGVIICNITEIEGVKTWCPWDDQSPNRIKYDYGSAASAIKGLERLGVLRRCPTCDFAHWQAALARRSERQMSGRYRYRYLYEVVDLDRLQRLAADPPVRTQNEWVVFYSKGGEQLPRELGFEEALTAVRRAVDKSADPCYLLIIAIDQFAHRLRKLQETSPKPTGLPKQ